MKIYSINDEKFRKYGQVINDDFSDILEVLKTRECPLDHAMYVASDKDLEACPSFNKLQNDYFGGLPIQIGHCSGHNNTLGCLEYHKSSEINMANEDFILLIGERKDIIDGKYDLSKVEGFLVPKGVAVEMYANTLHYCPCGVDNKEFRMLVVLPKGTNVGNFSSKLEPALRNNNKWLFAHSDTNEARDGAYVGLVGDKIVL